MAPSARRDTAHSKSLELFSSLARLECVTAPMHDVSGETGHVLMILSKQKKLPDDLPAVTQLECVLKRREMKPEELAKTPVAIDLAHGGCCVYVMLDDQSDRYTQHDVLRKAVMLLAEETPDSMALAVWGVTEDMQQRWVRDALYVMWVNGAALPSRKKKPARSLKRLVLYGAENKNQGKNYADIAALAQANLLARQLTVMPANELTPAHYREKIRVLAKTQGWGIKEFDFCTLQKMGAGAFCAVAQGSHEADAAIVHLSYNPSQSNMMPRVALVGKGICFDTGGHNLKPARYMTGMHEDMNGSAVALSLLLAIQALALPVAVDVWLAIAQNHLSSRAYKQNDIITTLDGTHVEIVHTDAEGRLVLADALTLATRPDEKKVKTNNHAEQTQPDLVIDFATLTGSMITALGTRYSGVFSSDDALGHLAVEAGRLSGERVCLFPMDSDYEPALDSKVADIKQCTLEGDADHILAARFLKRYTYERPWLHLDLSAANCSDGLGAVASGQTGFGVAWGVAFLSRWLESRAECCGDATT